MIAMLLALSDPALVQTGVGRFAQYADVASIVRQGDAARMRSLQVAEQGFHVGDVLYVGGWSRWVFDCRTRTADRLISLRCATTASKAPRRPKRPRPMPRRPAATPPNCWP